MALAESGGFHAPPPLWTHRLDEQLEALDALHQASMENFMIRSLEAKQLRDMAPQEVEGEMLQRVGCQRLREAMLQRHGEVGRGWGGNSEDGCYSKNEISRKGLAL